MYWSGDRQTQAGPPPMVGEVLPPDDILYRAVCSRDRRFDGRFMTAVVSTGIYCRPICPARTPLRRNVRFFPTAAAAEAAGFRPCRRCHPEAAPSTPEAEGPASVVTRALRRIDEGGLDGRSVAALAAELHVGERQLRRLFAQHVGASPAAVARHARLRRGRLLTESTDLPLAAVALDAGYGSVRQFNAAMATAFGASPRELRRRARRRAGAPASVQPPRPAAAAVHAGTSAPPTAAAPHADRPEQPTPAAPVRARLALRPPFAWPSLLAWLRARAIPGVEVVTETDYARTTATGTVRLVPHDDHVELTATGADELLDVVRRARRLLDLDADPSAIDPVLADDPALAALVVARPGLRLPGCWDPFELAVRAVLGQQISVPAATRLAGRIAAEHGEPVLEPVGALTHRFPTPTVLAEAELPFMPAARAHALRTLAAAAVTGALRLERWRDPAATRAELLALPGIGPWTAEYVAMRALGDPDAFPATDLVLRRALDGGADRAERWRPFRAYAAMQLWAAAASSADGRGARTRRSHQASSSTTRATTTGTVAG